MINQQKLELISDVLKYDLVKKLLEIRMHLLEKVCDKIGDILSHAILANCNDITNHKFKG